LLGNDRGGKQVILAQARLGDGQHQAVRHFQGRRDWRRGRRPGRQVGVSRRDAARAKEGQQGERNYRQNDETKDAKKLAFHITRRRCDGKGGSRASTKMSQVLTTVRHGLTQCGLRRNVCGQKNNPKFFRERAVFPKYFRNISDYPKFCGLV
jgi:hypothetical protein